MNADRGRSLKQKTLRFALALGVSGLLAGAFGLTTPFDAVAEAQRGLRARVYLTQARIPRSLTERRLISFARRHNARRLQETTDAPIAERDWRANMVTAFNRPVGDLEFQVLFYDIEDGARRFIGPPMSTFINNREEKTFVQRIRLERPHFDPNRRMELVVTVRRQEVGRARFEVVGERVQHSGEVTF
ncbi:MAG: hypothetical protein AB8H86_33730 [Polyangiales bacterium]